MPQRYTANRAGPRLARSPSARALTGLEARRIVTSMDRRLALGVTLATLVGLAGCSGGAPTPVHVDGIVRLGPFCPVERPGSPCPVPTGAFDGAEAVARAGGSQVRSPLFADGHFGLDLEAGHWNVTATAGMSCTSVEVSASGPVTIECDTGIR
jgi:hypothetical protein